MKKIIYILILLVGLNFVSSAQSNPVVLGTPTAKILSIYPIPATTIINFDFQYGYDKSYIFQIYNFPGKKVYELNNVPQKIILPLNEFYRGIYYYKLINRFGKTVESGRFLVIK